MRWLDWSCVALGVGLVFSPWASDYGLDAVAAGNAYGLGVVIAVFNLISACRLVDRGEEIFNFLLGVWLALAPFALNFAADRAAAASAISAGVVLVALAVLQMRGVGARRNG